MQTLKPGPFVGAAWRVDAKTATVVVQPPVVTPPVVTPPVVTPPASGPSGVRLTSTTAWDEQRVFQMDSYTGLPDGYKRLPGQDGWAYLPVRLKADKPGATALYIATYDFNEAFRTSPGKGTVIQPAVRVPGVNSVSVAEATYQVPVQERLGWQLIDVDTNADMSTAIRIPVKHGVGTGIAYPMSASNGAMLATSWAYWGGGQPGPEKFTTIDPFCVVYMPAHATGRAPIPNTWELPGSADVSPYDSPAIAEYFRLMRKKFNHNLFAVGASNLGSVSTQYQTLDPSDGSMYGTSRNAVGHADFKVAGYVIYMCYNGATSQIGRILEYTMMSRVLDDLQSRNPLKNTFTLTCTDLLQDSNNGSAHWGYYLEAHADLERNRPNTYQMDTYDAGGAGVGGHCSMVDRYRQARTLARYVLGAMGVIPLERGPQIISASRAGDTITIKFDKPVRKYAWDQGNPGTSTGYTEPDVSKIPDGALAWTFSLYAAGHTAGSNPAPVPLTGQAMQLVDPLTLKMFLAPDSSRKDTDAYDLYLGRDFQAYPQTNGSVVLVGDEVGGLGIGYGMTARRTIAPVYVPAPAPAPLTLKLDVLPVVSPGSLVVPRFTGAGPTLCNAGDRLFSDSLEVSFDDKSFVPVPAQIQNDNKGYALVPVPVVASGTSLPLSIRAKGTTATLDRRVVSVRTARDRFPDPDGTGLPGAIVAIHDVHESKTLWADRNKTRLAGFGDTVMCHADALGDPRNDLIAEHSGKYGGPLLSARKVPWSNKIDDRRNETVYLQYGYDYVEGAGNQQRLVNMNGPAVAAMGGDAAIFFVSELNANSGWAFALGQFGQPGSTACFAMQSKTGPNVGRFSAAGQWAAGQGITWDSQLDYVVASWDSVARALTVTSRYSSVTMANTSIPPSTGFNAYVVGGHFQSSWDSLKFEKSVLFNRKLSPTEAAALVQMGQAEFPWGA